MEDFLSFRKMITPVIIQIIFWMGVVASIIIGVVMIAKAGTPGALAEGGIGAGILLIVLGPIACRVYCELLIIFFAMHDRLREMGEEFTRLAHAMVREPGSGGRPSGPAPADDDRRYMPPGA